MAKVYDMLAKKTTGPPGDYRRGRIVGPSPWRSWRSLLVLFVIYLDGLHRLALVRRGRPARVFWRQVWSRLIVGVAAGVIFFAIFYAERCGSAAAVASRHRAFEGIDVVEYVITISLSQPKTDRM